MIRPLYPYVLSCSLEWFLLTRKKTPVLCSSNCWVHVLILTAGDIFPKFVRKMFSSPSFCLEWELDDYHLKAFKNVNLNLQDTCGSVIYVQSLTFFIQIRYNLFLFSRNILLLPPFPVKMQLQRFVLSLLLNVLAKHWIASALIWFTCHLVLSARKKQSSTT